MCKIDHWPTSRTQWKAADRIDWRSYETAFEAFLSGLSEGCSTNVTQAGDVGNAVSMLNKVEILPAGF
jgi:hypothetical protein